MSIDPKSAGAKTITPIWWFPQLAFAVLALVMTASVPLLAEAKIVIKQPYHICYDLKPITIEMEGGDAWAVYDVWKNEAGGGTLKGGKAVFTPPGCGWYAVTLLANQQPVAQQWLGVTQKFKGMHTLAAGEAVGGWNDEAMQAFGGFMLDRTNTRMGHENAEKVIAKSNQYGVTLLMQFEGMDKASDLKHVKEYVTRYKGRVKYWELVNEPNFGSDPAKYVKMLNQTVPLIKSIDPKAVVMGPDTCGINLGWYEQVYKLGGGKLLDAISIHDYEGHDSIDPFHWNAKMTELRKIMAQNGDKDKPIWQTERSLSATYAGNFRGGANAVRITLERDLLESFGVTNNHNNYYYVSDTGYHDVPGWVWCGDGPYPALLAVRTRCAMTLDRPFAKKLDFGPTGNKLLLGLLYQGKDGSTVTLRNLGAPGLKLTVDVSGGGPIEVVDAWGNSEQAIVDGGKATLVLSTLPTYLRLKSGQSVTVPKIDFGKNLAKEADFSYSGGKTSDFKLLVDGIFQNYHPQSPLGFHWSGDYPGTVYDEKTETLEMTFPGKRKVERVVVFGVRADNQYCALLDYDLQYHDGKDWVTIDAARAPCPPSDPVPTFTVKSTTWYLDHNFFVHQFAPVETKQLRLLVRRITRGCRVDMIGENSVNHRASDCKLALREIEIYAPAPATGCVGIIDASAVAKAPPKDAGEEKPAAPVPPATPPVTPPTPAPAP